MGTQIHRGSWLECKMCHHTDEELHWRREKKDRVLRHKRIAAGTPDLAVRRQVAFELGPDAEPTSDQKFQLLQKFGVAAARIDRAITRPKWMTEGRWKTLKAEWFQLTKNLVPKEQFKRTPRPVMSKQEQESQQRRQHHSYPQRNSSDSRQSYAPARTVSRPR